MDNGNKTPNLNLPPPLAQSMEAAPPAAPAEGQPGLEAAPVSQKETAATPAPVMPAMPQDPIAAASAQAIPAAMPAAGAPAIADDNDLIEKEWVLKAKQIVEKTKDDPYNQNKELNVFKADYMKKRYNKTIKLSE